MSVHSHIFSNHLPPLSPMEALYLFPCDLMLNHISEFCTGTLACGRGMLAVSCGMQQRGAWGWGWAPTHTHGTVQYILQQDRCIKRRIPRSEEASENAIEMSMHLCLCVCVSHCSPHVSSFSSPSFSIHPVTLSLSALHQSCVVSRGGPLPLNALKGSFARDSVCTSATQAYFLPDKLDGTLFIQLLVTGIFCFVFPFHFILCYLFVCFTKKSPIDGSFWCLWCHVANKQKCDRPCIKFVAV